MGLYEPKELFKLLFYQFIPLHLMISSNNPVKFDIDHMNEVQTTFMHIRGIRRFIILESNWYKYQMNVCKGKLSQQMSLL